MTAEHFEETLDRLHKRTPYRPIKVILINDRQFEIDDPHALTHRAGVAAFIHPGGRPEIFDFEGVRSME